MCCDVWCLRKGSLLGLHMLYFFFHNGFLFISFPKKTYPKVQTLNIVKKPWITYPYSCSICLGMPKYFKIQFRVIFLYDTIWRMALVLEFLFDHIKINTLRPLFEWIVGGTFQNPYMTILIQIWKGCTHNAHIGIYSQFKKPLQQSFTNS